VLGDVSVPTFTVRFDWHDKYIAAGCGDGTIRIFNVFTGKQSYLLNTEMEEPMPTLNLRWRPLNAPGVTKNVLLAVNANGDIQHWHTTSGRQLNTISVPYQKILCADYKADGTDFVTGAADNVIRVYDEQTRQLK